MSQQPDASKPVGDEVYSEIARLSKKRITDMLLRMIDSAQDYHGWSLSDEDGSRMVKLIKHKQRIICSSFSFQLNRHFTEFREIQSPSQELAARDWQKIGLVGANAETELNELLMIAKRYQEAFKDFDRTILKRLQTCIKRSRASIYENPLQVKRLCESFQYAIDSLNLETNYKIALYHLFADRFVECLGPLYRHIDQALIDQGMLPEMPAAMIDLRSLENLSESRQPAAINPGQSITLLMTLQGFKEKSRQSCSDQNLFPELRERFERYQLGGYDESIDQLNMIFKLIFEDEDLPQAIKQQLGRLQIYVFITAIQEDGFLRRSSNPARRLLDSVIKSEVEIARGDNPETSGIDYLREHIDAMTNRGFITLESYSELLEGYEAFLRDHEIECRKARKAEAARRILPDVKSRLNELTQPLRIQGTSLILYEKVWQPLLVQIALQQGIDSETWNKALIMVKKQVWSQIPKSDREEQIELVKTLPQVSHTLHRAMRSLRLPNALQLSLTDYLKLAQQEVIDATARNIEEKKRRQRTLGEQSFDAMKESTEEFDAMMQTGVFQVLPDMMEALNAEASAPAQPEEIESEQPLQKGEWVNMNSNGEVQLAKLAWKADDDNLFIFVDRDGRRICEVDAETLDQRFKSGTFTRLESGTISSEKSRFSVLKSL